MDSVPHASALDARAVQTDANILHLAHWTVEERQSSYLALYGHQHEVATPTTLLLLESSVSCCNRVLACARILDLGAHASGRGRMSYTTFPQPPGCVFRR
jgi:hypothetical protein